MVILFVPTLMDNGQINQATARTRNDQDHGDAAVARKGQLSMMRLQPLARVASMRCRMAFTPSCRPPRSNQEKSGTTTPKCMPCVSCFNRNRIFHFVLLSFRFQPVSIFSRPVRP